MNWKRKLRIVIRAACGWWRMRRMLLRCNGRMSEVETGCQWLVRLGFLNSYDFYQDRIIFDWKFHPSHLPPIIASETIWRFTTKLERKWRWSVRLMMRTARAWDLGFAEAQSVEHKFPLDYRF